MNNGLNLKLTKPFIYKNVDTLINGILNIELGNSTKKRI